jgi:hypothetical protein
MEVIKMTLKTIVCISFIVLSLMLAGVSEAKIEGLVAHYKCDEGSGTEILDSSGIGNNGTIVGKADWGEGKYDKAFQFDGATYIDLAGKDFQQKPKDAITLCVWVNHEASGEDKEIFECIGTGHGSGQYHVEISPSNTMRWFHRDETSTEVFNVRGFGTVPVGKWTHIAGTYDSGSKKAILYINGELVKELDGTGADLSTDWDVSATIGQHGKVRWFKGLMDEFYLWDRALTASEIIQVRDNKTASVSPSGKLTTTWADIKQ